MEPKDSQVANSILFLEYQDHQLAIVMAADKLVLIQYFSSAKLPFIAESWGFLFQSHSMLKDIPDATRVMNKPDE